MKFLETTLPGSLIIEPSVIGDSRGWFTRVFDKEILEQKTGPREWVQGNHSFTRTTGSLRGMHYQHQPFAEAKLVRCISGAVFDVIVDIRTGSTTFLQWYAVELSAVNRKTIFIPEGFAHGFQTLEPNTELVYSHSAPYTPSAEGGLRYNDPRLAIDWPIPVTDISLRDNQHPFIDDFFSGEKIISP